MYSRGELEDVTLSGLEVEEELHALHLDLLRDISDVAQYYIEDKGDVKIFRNELSEVLDAEVKNALSNLIFIGRK